MKILHIFTNMNYVYTKALIDLFGNWIPEYKQEFLICDNMEKVPNEVKEILKNKNRIHYLKNNNIRLQAFEIIKYQKKFDYTIFHFLPNDILLHSYYFINRSRLNNVIWRIWGADLYNWRKQGIQGLLFNYLRFHSRNNIKYIVAEPMDIPEFKRQFGENALFLSGPDPKGYDVNFLENNFCKKPDEAVWILLGHSAVKTLHHKEMLEKLSAYKNEDIKIILPLNYGDMSYGQDVYEYACTLFPSDKIILIDNKISLDKYVELLWKCDIEIIHSERQIAMGNIIMMMYMRKKIFLMKDSIMDDYYRKIENLEIYDSKEIGELSYEDFVNHNFSEKNKDYAIKEINVSAISDTWRKTFMMLEEKLEERH